MHTCRDTILKTMKVCLFISLSRVWMKSNFKIEEIIFTFASLRFSSYGGRKKKIKKRIRYYRRDTIVLITIITINMNNIKI